jgi:O-phospho-L-seryl-tRNASec:L-selenocysteinyl-tRNA synthase
VRTDLAAIEAQLKKLGSDNVLAIMTTSCCFAPRVPDRVVEVAKIAKAAGVPHVINNAYGVQTSNAMKLITTAKRRGRVDAFICSTDKNFMVPVGGSIITGFDVKFIDEIAKTYPGRAAMTPLCDIFITLLSLGKNGWVTLLSQREQLLPYFKATLAKVAAKHGERLLETPNNLISVGVTLGSFIRKPVAQAASEEDGVEVAAAAVPDRKSSQSNLSFIGSMMFSRLISGARTVPQHVEKTIVGYSFHGYGASHAGFPHPYATFACAIGMTKADVDVMATRFDKTLKDARKKLAKQVKQLAVKSPCMQQKQQKTPLVTPSLTTQSINQPQR